MGKIAIWILIVIAVMLVIRLIAVKKRPVDEDVGGKEKGKGGRPGSRGDTDRSGRAGELMMSCAVCGMHLPSSEAVFAHGKVFCGPEHRDVEEARRDEA